MKGRERSVIELTDVAVMYGSQTVLEDVQLSVRRGDFLGIIGPNGGGKSTLLKVILGLIRPYRGRVSVLGKRPEEVRDRIGYVPQYANYDRQFPVSVWDVVLMGRRGHRGLMPFYGANDRARARKALEAVEMYEFGKRRIDDLSGGQRQRVFIARALCTDPEIMLLDEPTASVDIRMQESIYDLLKKLNESMTIILVTHDIGVISSYVSSISCLNRSIYHGDGQNLSSEQLEAAYNCPVELIAHGVPHRVLPEHRH